MLNFWSRLRGRWQEQTEIDTPSQQTTVPTASEETLDRQIKELVETQQPGRYEVRVRRKSVHF